jgi:tRNA(fMet)-specific endonuclease VapC
LTRFASSSRIPTVSGKLSSDDSRERGFNMVSLDSSFLIDLLAGETGARDKAAQLDASDEPRVVTAPAVSEVLLGAYRIGGGYLERTRLLLDQLPLLAFDGPACHEAGRLGAELQARGTPLSPSDLFIGAITRRHGERLLTRDRGFTVIPGLAIESY